MCYSSALIFFQFQVVKNFWCNGIVCRLCKSSERGKGCDCTKCELSSVNTFLYEGNLSSRSATQCFLPLVAEIH